MESASADTCRPPSYIRYCIATKMAAHVWVRGIALTLAVRKSCTIGAQLRVSLKPLGTIESSDVRGVSGG